jgi:hypothetical protein
LLSAERVPFLLLGGSAWYSQKLMRSRGSCSPTPAKPGIAEINLCAEDAQAFLDTEEGLPWRSWTKKPVPVTEKARARAPDLVNRRAAWINPECVS